MKTVVNRGADPQRAPHLAACSICGALLYRGDSCWYVSGLCFCEDCLDELARLEFAAHHCICGEETIV